MAARQTDYITVSRPDDLDELERRLAEGGIDELTVDIPDSATTLFTAREFRQLAAAALDAGVELRIATSDPLRRELAHITGLPVVGPATAAASMPDEPSIEVDAAPAVAESVHERDAPTRPIVVSSVEDADYATAHKPISPWRGAETVSYFDDDDIDDDSFSFVITPPTRPASGHTEDLDASWTAWSTHSHGRAQARPHRSHRGMRVVATVLVLLIALAGFLAVLAPAATIAISPRIDAVAVQVSYGLATAGGSFDLPIEPTAVSTTVTSSASIPTTGERFVPDASATGSLVLTNPRTTDTLVEAGTVASGSDGVEYVTTADVVVPASDPWWTMAFGSITAPIRATEAGTKSNADAESIFGIWDNGIFYTNRDAITGGSMKRIATVTEADRAALDAMVRGDIDSRAADAMTGLVPTGATLVSGSEHRGDAALQFDHQVGDDADALRVEASMPVSANIFDPDAMRTQAADEVSRRLASAAGDGQLVEGSTLVADPQPLGDSPEDGYVISASARIQRPVDRVELEALRSRSGGAAVADVVGQAEQVDGVGQVNVDRRNAWLLSGMPLLTSRITIEVQGAETAIPTQATPTGP